MANAAPDALAERYQLPELHGRLFDGTHATAAMRLQAQARNLRDNGACMCVGAEMCVCACVFCF
jgi:hypothetical protein